MIASALRSAALPRVAHALGELLLPRACVACARLLDRGDHDLVCGRCWARVHELPHPRCERCGHPLTREHCAWCELLPPYVRAARSVCWIPGQTAGTIIHALKYAGWRGVADQMGARMARLAWPADVIAERTAFVPVPLATSRQRERGYNQSALLARALSSRCHVPVNESCLVRTRRTATQTRLTPEDRRHNVSGAFAVPASERTTLRGAHLVLVDDVITTGATLGECAATLFDAGARIISIVTFGRAPAIGDAG